MHHIHVLVDEYNICDFSDSGTGIIWNFKLAFLEGHCDMGLWETFFWRWHSLFIFAERELCVFICKVDWRKTRIIRKLHWAGEGQCRTRLKIRKMHLILCMGIFYKELRYKALLDFLHIQFICVLGLRLGSVSFSPSLMFDVYISQKRKLGWMQMSHSWERWQGLHFQLCLCSISNWTFDRTKLCQLW